MQIDKKGINFVNLVFKIDARDTEIQRLVKFLDLWAYTIK